MISQPDITKSTDAAIRLVASLPQQVRYAASRAINSALRTGQEAQRARMAQVFDRPTPYTVRGGTAIAPSTRDKLTGALAIATGGATAGGNVPAGKPLLAEVQGGTRRMKRSEVLLKRAGLLPAGWLTVPGRGARIDGYGNLQRGQLLQILAYFSTYGATARSGKALRSNTSDKGRARLKAGTRNRAGLEYFALQPGNKSGLKPGIYARPVAAKRFSGPLARPRAVLVFVPQARYEARYDFMEQADAAISAALPIAYAAEFRNALAGAR